MFEPVAVIAQRLPPAQQGKRQTDIPDPASDHRPVKGVSGKKVVGVDGVAFAADFCFFLTHKYKSFLFSFALY